MTKYNLSQIMKAAISRKKEARKMTITINELYKTLDQLKARNGIPCIACSNAYDRKDALKALGYRFEPIEKKWKKVIDPDHFMDLCAETAIACKLSPEELDRFCTKLVCSSKARKAVNTTISLPCLVWMSVTTITVTASVIK